MRQVRVALIGSRKTPWPVLQQVIQLSCALATAPENRYLLPNSHIRHVPQDIEFVGISGGAAGFDEAAETGFKQAGRHDKFKCFLPEEGYRGNKSRLFHVSDRAIEICKQYHPAPDKLHGLTLKLLARDSYHILDETLDNPVDAVICWTEDGKASGGTGQALRIAAGHGITDVFNLQHLNGLEKLNNWLWRLK